MTDMKTAVDLVQSAALFVAFVWLFILAATR